MNPAANYPFLNSIDDLRSNALAWDESLDWGGAKWSLPSRESGVAGAAVAGKICQRFFMQLPWKRTGRWVAALPLISGQLAGLLPVGSLPCNPWSPCE